MLDGVIVAFSGGVFGIGLGLLCAGPMLAIVTESLGWTLDYRVPGAQIAIGRAALLALSVLAGIYPARGAYRAPTAYEALGD
ncbi:MAG: hypothetical protein JRG82_05020 [Deltaproteobacteria bacterium]|nr:hypothetical protein [Deltaproteobacteria bacterium]